MDIRIHGGNGLLLDGPADWSANLAPKLKHSYNLDVRETTRIQTTRLEYPNRSGLFRRRARRSRRPPPSAARWRSRSSRAKRRPRGLLHKRGRLTICSVIGGFLGCVGVGATDPTGELPMTTAGRCRRAIRGNPLRGHSQAEAHAFSSWLWKLAGIRFPVAFRQGVGKGLKSADPARIDFFTCVGIKSPTTVFLDTRAAAASVF